jgi:hypothetical protein
MKALNVIFWAAVGGVALSFAGAIGTWIKSRQVSATPEPIVTPAVLPGGAS